MSPNEAEALAAMAARRLSGVADLRAELLLRCDELGPKRLSTPMLQQAIGEVLDVFRLAPFRLYPLPDACVIEDSSEVGRVMSFQGFLADENNGQAVALISRKLLLDVRIANHAYLEVQTPYRGGLLALVLLDRAFDFYRSLNFHYVQISAGLASGRWYWARCGFDFDPMYGDAARVRDWAARVMDGIGYVPPVTPSNAYDLAVLGTEEDPPVTVSFAQVDAAAPGRAGHLLEIAEGNSIDWREPILLGRAILLSGYDWRGRFDLRNPALQADFDQQLRDAIAKRTKLERT